MESRKMALMSLFSGQQWRNRHKNRPKDMGGGDEVEGEVYGESNMEVYSTIYKTDSQWEFAV